MTEENLQEPTAVDPSEVDALKRSVESLEKKNFELIGKLKKKETPDVPSDYQDLLDFKQKAEQKELEAKGDYSKALESREGQFRDAVKEKDDKIKKLEAKIRDLELISPALAALSNAVHDTDYALEKLGKDKFEVAEDGSVVYVDEFSRMTIEEAVQKKLAANDRTRWVVKKPVAKGSGAVGGGNVAGGKISEGDLKHFLPETQNIDEQTRIYKQQGPEVWRKYREMAESR
jgi:predicted RNase H-like nuclease (RuvC/YqgF family)